MQNKTLLLAGAGDLALHTAPLMMQQGFQVWGMRRNPPAAPDAIQWLSANLGLAPTLTSLPSQFTHVLYAPAPDARQPEAYQTVFRDGLENLLDHLDLNILERIVFVSSTAVYGPSNDWIDEDTPPAPKGFNGKILMDSERYLHARLPDKAVVLRPSGLYGPRRTQLLQRLTRGLARIPAAPISGANSDIPKNWTNRFHIEDASRACAHLLTLKSPLPCYIGTDDTPMPMDELYTRLADSLGAPLPERDPSSPAAQGKRLSNKKLVASGLRLRWPDTIEGYQALIKQGSV